MMDKKRHYWVGDARDQTKPRLGQHVLCTINDLAREKTLPDEHGEIHVTSNKEGVTCQECLELIHA